MCYIVYLDDLLIYFNYLYQDRQDIDNILEEIWKSETNVKSSECDFHQAEMEYLKFIINWERIKTDPVKTKAIWDCKTPKGKTDIQSSLGFCNFNGRFIKGFSRTAQPVYD